MNLEFFEGIVVRSPNTKVSKTLKWTIRHNSK